MRSTISMVFLVAAGPVAAMQTVFVPPDATLSTITIGSNDLKAQALPIHSVRDWPVWMASADGLSLTKVWSEGDDTWVNAATFEQLWLPIDQPPPACHAALGAVLKNGMPRYIFPCLETSLTTVGGSLDGTVWHNRGMNSLPLAKTWLEFGEVPAGSLRLSCYRKPLPPPPPPAEAEEEQDGSSSSSGVVEEAASEATEDADWVPVLPLTGVSAAVSTLFEIVADAPDRLGEGWAYVVVPLRDEASGDAVSLPADALVPGQRLRLFLSDVEATPTALDPDDRESWVYHRGESDLFTYSVAAGSESEFLPAAYEPLYKPGPGAAVRSCAQ